MKYKELHHIALNEAVREVKKDIDEGRSPIGTIRPSPFKASNLSQHWEIYQRLRHNKKFWVWWHGQYDYQKGLCYYCHRNLEELTINVEHIVPFSRCGSNKPNNLVLACSDCNKEKQNKAYRKRKRKLLRDRFNQVLADL